MLELLVFGVVFNGVALIVFSAWALDKIARLQRENERLRGWTSEELSRELAKPGQYL